jgi:hypothetical protein
MSKCLTTPARALRMPYKEKNPSRKREGFNKLTASYTA